MKEDSIDEYNDKLINNEDILDVNFNKTSQNKKIKHSANNNVENIFLKEEESENQLKSSIDKSNKSSKKVSNSLKKRGIHNTIYEGFSQKEKRGKENWAFLNNCIKDINTKSIKSDSSIDLKIYSVIFNMQGKIPSKNDIEKLLPKKNYNMYIIGGVECMRSILLSVFYDNKDEWIEMIK